ncbi:MAG TPA: YfbR-like 5'-deoxynucleotidase [Candidatus Acidoferrales bacterium]|nr:YfbR-like 5'-deoxynucleotidase [Candidatus Acidoferrales bacterium]
MNKSPLDFLLDIRSLMTVGRFSVYKCHFREDVAQHSYFTALYAMVLVDLERKLGTPINVERLLRMALLHDAEEARTGDVHHPFKHQDSAFAEALNSRALEWFGKLLDGLPEDMERDYLALRRADSDASSSIEASILKAADKIEALLWAYEEYLLGNVHVRRALIVEDITSKLEEIELASVTGLVAEIRTRLGETPSTLARS